MAGIRGLEPLTSRLTAERSTIELYPNKKGDCFQLMYILHLIQSYLTIVLLRERPRLSIATFMVSSTLTTNFQILRNLHSQNLKKLSCSFIFQPYPVSLYPTRTKSQSYRPLRVSTTLGFLDFQQFIMMSTT